LQELAIAWWLQLRGQIVGRCGPRPCVQFSVTSSFHFPLFQLTPLNKCTLFFPFIGRWGWIWTRRHWWARNTVQGL